MPTPLDRALSNQNAFLAFGGIITAVAAWSIWGQDMFPKEQDPTGEPERWTREEMRRWLAARNLHPNSKDTQEQLLERIKSNLLAPRA
ncbi:hypothetical protein BJ878DRAFT_459273 [Calycina marina]|uniref:STE24 endopeptidase n=1 Tax=Calycina marina TaxID=1763456 RepID=A0A9P7Z461_9HELO|nr:hypothetical protein BJ878DRAFT_459273 [Calycina marina]